METKGIIQDYKNYGGVNIITIAITDEELMKAIVMGTLKQPIKIKYEVENEE